MVSERLHPRQEMVASDWVGISDPRKIPSRWRSVTADRPYSFSSYGGAPVNRPYSFSGYGGAPADRPSSLSGYGGAPAVRPSSLSGYGGAPAVRPSSLSGYGGGPNRCLVKVPGSTPGKIPNPSSNLGKMTKWVVRYEEDASDPTAVWRIATAVNHKADMGQQQRGDFQKVMTGLKESMNRVENLLQRLANLQDRGAINLRPIEEPRNVSVLIQPREMARRTEDLRQISLNDTQEIQSVSIPEGNLHFPSTDLSEVVTGWGEDPLPHDFIAFPHLNNLNPSHGPEMAKDMEKGVSAVAKKHAQNDIVGQNMNLTTAARGKLLNEAQFDLAQLYMGKRADKKLRGTGLFWKTPPWPDFCIEELKAVYKSELMEMRHEVEEERMILQMARVWRVERVQRKLVVAKLTVDSKYAPLNKLQSDLEEFLSFHRGNSVDEEIQKSAEESGDRRIAKMCLGMLKAMRSHPEYNYVAYRKGIGIVCNKRGGSGVDDRWLWSTGLLWNLPPGPNLSLCEADWMANNIEKGAAAMCLRMAAMFGGIVGQEVVQACLGKFHPVNQFSYFDSVESLPVEPLESGDLKSENTRYTAQISVLRSKFRKKLEQAKIFMVGSGALGCEVLKNPALMGISCSPDGKLTVTDDDVMEKSNLSRQFLFHDWNSGQPKSTVAATVVMAINLKIHVEANQNRVSPETENVFSDAFWESFDVVINALGKVTARMYIDSRCVYFQKPLPESGTLGAHCNTHMAIPFLTENYGASRDPPEKQAPRCTVHSFPQNIDYCLTWARSEFEGLLEKNPTEVNAFLSSPIGYAAASRTVKSMMEERGLVQIADPTAIETMDKKNNLHNLSVIAHVDHGKFTLTDSLVAAAGITVQEVAGDVSKTDTRIDEAKRGITIKSTGNSLFYEITEESLKSYKSERLWGENFSDPTTKKWTTMNIGSATCKRGFVQFCYEPIKQIIKTCMNDQKDKLWSILRKLGVTLKTDEKELMGKTLIKSVMQTCLLACNALLEMMIFHLPFSSKAQEYRVENLYKEPLDDIYAVAIRNCDLEGKFATGMKVRILDPNYVPGQNRKKGLYVKSVQHTEMWMRKPEEITKEECAASTELTSAKVYASPIKLQVFTFAEAYDFKDLEFMFQEVATGFKTKVMFIYVDIAEENLAKPFLTFYGLKPEKPTVTAFDISKGAKYLIESDINVKDLREFCLGLLDVTLPPYFRSELVPRKMGLVEKVVRSTFNYSVLESPENVLLEVYAPWCVDCEAISKNREKIAKHFSGLNNLKSARIDAAVNEHLKLQKLSLKDMMRFIKEKLQIADLETVPAADNSKFSVGIGGLHLEICLKDRLKKLLWRMLMLSRNIPRIVCPDYQTLDSRSKHLRTSVLLRRRHCQNLVF